MYRLSPNEVFGIEPVQFLNSGLRDDRVTETRPATLDGTISMPMFAAMTDISKITSCEGTISDRNAEQSCLLLQNCCRYEKRPACNPSRELPDTAHADVSGHLRVWYPDGPRASDE